MIEELRKLERKGLITLRAHDELPLLIANYTPEVQYERLWDEHELIKQCRGLIIDEDGEVVARPFEKFFNLEEHQEFDSLPDIPVFERFEVYEKLDGSMGIIYWYEGKWRVATRGSFHSDQADKARELLQNYETEKMDKFYTYIVEIIYPENRIVVNYGDKEELIMVAKIHTETGAEPMQLSSLHESNVFPIVQSHLPQPPEKMKELFSDENGEEREGFVFHYESGLRVKVKLDDYVRLHRLMTGLTARKVWELVKDGEDVEELYETAPDEVYDWVEEQAKYIRMDYKETENLAIKKYNNILSELEDEGYTPDDTDYRKQFALKVKSDEDIKKLNLNSIMFNLLDDRDYSEQIWKNIKPEHETINTTK